MIKKTFSLLTIFTLIFGVLLPSYAFADTTEKESAPEFKKETKEFNGNKIGVYSGSEESDESKEEFMELWESNKAKVADSSDGDIELFYVPNPGSGWDSIGSRDNGFSSQTHYFIKSTVGSSAGSIATGASKPFVGGWSYVIGGFAGTVAYMVTGSSLPTKYTTTEIFEYYSSYHGKYVYRPVTNLYQNQYRNEDQIMDTTLGPVLELTINGELQPIY